MRYLEFILLIKVNYFIHYGVHPINFKELFYKEKKNCPCDFKDTESSYCVTQRRARDNLTYLTNNYNPIIYK